MTDDEVRQKRRQAVELVAGFLRVVAEQYESGSRRACSAQEALLLTAIEIETALQAREDAGLL
jgi:hypothetical protein